MRSLILSFLTVFIVSSCAYLPPGLPGAKPRISKPLVSYKKPDAIETTNTIDVSSETADPKQSEQIPEDFVKDVKDEKGKRFVLDKSKPASFADYQKWRRENDPGGQVYAEFKQWEAILKERKLRQQQNKAK